MITSAKSSAGNHIRRPLRSDAASVPKNASANASAIVYENSPASVLASVPPAMCWLNAMPWASELVPGRR